MPLYFAYGSNMNAEAMARRCPRSKAVGLARLARHRLAVMREGWLTVVRDSRASAHGILWDLALSDVRALDRYEGPLYAKIVQPVLAQLFIATFGRFLVAERRTPWRMFAVPQYDIAGLPIRQENVGF
jgi:hypothetical protein